MSISITNIFHVALNSKRHRIKKTIYVKPKHERNQLGQFTGKIRKGYSRRIYDYKAPKVTGLELMRENIEKNNILLKNISKTALTKEKSSDQFPL